MVISDVHFKAIQYIIEGRPMTDIAKMCNISRATLYNWVDNSEFKAELDKQRQDIKNNVTSKISGRLEGYIDELHKIAMTSKSEKDKRAALEYLVDRVLGKSTTKVADVTEEEDKTEIPDIDAMLERLDKEIV